MATTIKNKLHIGCRFDYKPDYLNIDIASDAVVDIRKSAVEMRFNDNQFSEILLHDVIEHLGYCDSYILFAKAYKWLQPGGTIIISTPNIEESISQYSKTESLEAKENILVWIYGTEDVGMSHKFCFPFSFLESLLKKSGFNILEKKECESIIYRPSINLVVEKVENRLYPRRAIIIQKLYDEKSANISYTDFPCFEMLLETFIHIQDDHEMLNFLHINKLVAPKILMVFLENVLEDDAFFDKYLYEDILKELQQLSHQNFLPYLLSLFISKQIDNFEGAMEKLKKFKQHKKLNNYHGALVDKLPFLNNYTINFLTKNNFINYLSFLKASYLKYNNSLAANEIQEVLLCLLHKQH